MFQRKDMILWTENKNRTIRMRKMSHYLMRYVLEKGGELVAAFDMNPAMIGTDIGTHLGMENLA